MGAKIITFESAQRSGKVEWKNFVMERNDADQFLKVTPKKATQNSTSCELKCDALACANFIFFYLGELNFLQEPRIKN